MFGYAEEIRYEIDLLRAENEKLKLRLSVAIKSLPTTEDIEHFASNKRKEDWSVELGNGASEYERGLIFGAKWIKEQIEGNVL